MKIQRYSLVFFCALLVLLASGTLSGAPASDSENSHTTAFFNLRAAADISEYAGIASSALRKGLPKLNYLALLSYDEMSAVLKKNKKKIYCADNAAAYALGGILEQDRVLYGYIEKITKQSSERLGSAGGNKYVVENKEKVSFIITVIIVDVKQKKTIALIKERSNDILLGKSVQTILKKIQTYYLPKKKETPEAPKPAEKKKELSAPKEIKNTPSRSKPYVSLAGSFLLPQGTLAELTGYGMGGQLCIGVTDVFIPNLILQCSAAAFSMTPKQKNIDVYYLFALSADAGYRFAFERWHITPMMGYGRKIDYLNSDIDGPDASGVYTYHPRWYSDALLSLKLQSDYFISRSTALTASAGLLLFFEKNNTGEAIELTAGVKQFF